MQQRNRGNRLALACALALGTAVYGAMATPASAIQPATKPGASKALDADMGTLEKYIVVLERAPVALYEGEVQGLSRIPRQSDGRLDTQSTEARVYAASVEDEQQAFVRGLQSEFGRTPNAVAAFQHAINAVVLELSGKEALALAAQPGVKLVEPYKILELDTDRGPTLIGAPDVWSGTNTRNNVGTRGEGVVVGDIDSGANLLVPSFAEVGPVTGYQHTNPLGPGNRLGLCNTIDASLCNEKVIGTYDFVYTAVCSPSTPATDPCRVGGTITEEPSATDSNGHGSHTASTAVGNTVNINYRNSPFTLSGVAPHANLIVYDACYNRNSDNAGLCPNVSTIASFNQAVADGVVDVINYSIGGGASPWSDTVSLAMLGAHNAGIFISASAGNSGPGPGTLGHVEPWTMTSAASNHGRSALINVMNVDQPPNAPGGPQGVRVDIGAAGAPHNTNIVDQDVVLSPGYAASATVGNDGCTGVAPAPVVSPYVAGQFTGKFVMIRRGTCSFSEKAKNAQDAGAIGVLIAQNQPGLVAPAATAGFTITIPVFGVQQVDADAIRTYVNGDPSSPTKIDIPLALTTVPNTVDAIAGFSSRGPSFFDILKPDITAPGVSILAAYKGGATAYDLLDGTSMSTPHNTGSIALLRSLQPNWTPAMLKSALMMTSQSTGIVKQDNVTPSDPWDRGAGRTAVREATKAGLVLDETGANYSAANPLTGGQPSLLNLPSYAHQNCLGTCSFPRTFRSTLPGAVTWTPSVNGAIAPAVTLPPAFTIGSGDSRTISVQVDSTQISNSAYTFGEIVLTPSVAGIPALHLPMAIKAALPEIAVTPTALSATATVETSVTKPLSIANLGNPTLNWNIVTGTQNAQLLNLPQTSSGQRAQIYAQVTGAPGEYVFEDFLAPGNVSITSLQANGFTLPSGSNLAPGVARGVTFRVYADAAGVPAGNPELPGSPAPLWTYSSTFATIGVPTAGITMTANNIALNLAAAGAPALNLAPGRYWFTAMPHMPGNGSGGSAANTLWAWRSATFGEGGVPVAIFPFLGDEEYFPTGDAGMSAIVNSTVSCGVPWASADITTGNLGLGGSSNLTVTFNATGLTPGVYRGALCVASNDSDEALVPIALEFTVDGVQTNPTLTVEATPQTLSITEQVLIEATVTPGTFPTSTGIAVNADLSPIGGAASQPLNDAGSNGDTTAGDGVYSHLATVAANTTFGNKTINVSMTDAQARTANGSTDISINATVAPEGVGAATPANTWAGGTTLVTVDVTPGSNPVSTGISVTTDLTAIGGAASVALLDDGTNGDETAADGRYSREVSVAANINPGIKLLPTTVADAQSRSDAFDIGLTIDAPTAISGTGAAAPSTVARGGSTLLTVDVAEGANPPSSGVTVTIDLTSIGSGSVATMYDDATHGDATAGDGIFSLQANVAVDTAPGGKTLTASIGDAQARTATTDIAITVTASVAPAAVGLATPSFVGVNGTTLLTVSVTPGSSPASTGIAVVANLASIGGSLTQSFVDDGTGGDAVAGDNVFSYQATVAAGTTVGAKSLPVSVVDAQLRTASTSIALTVQGQPIFADGFEN